MRNGWEIRKTNRAMRASRDSNALLPSAAPRTPPQYIHCDKTFELNVFPCNRYEEEHTRSDLVGIHRNDFFLKEAQYEC